jgi:tetratricopeptide (TPR) repeat protein
MQRTVLLSALILSLFPVVGVAQTQGKQPVLDPYGSEAIVFERSETTYRMRANGTGERDMHAVVRIQSQGAAQAFGVLSFSYAAANETPLIKLVRVHKPDGTTVDTPATDAIDMAAAVTREAPLYSDLKEKHLPVRSLSPGDTLEYEVDTTINKAEMPGQFWGATHFTVPGTFVVLAEVLTLEVPADKYVQVWSPNHKPTISEHDDLRTYTWNVPQLVTAPKNTGDGSTRPPAPKDPDEDADGRKLPSVAWTTFHSWSEVGDWYRSLALSRTEPTATLRARAEEITKDAKTPEDQVRAIYNFVSTRTRYVGIDFGIGRYQPHTAEEVLANQYGDCKDKDTLLEALLRAKGFSTAPALIGAGIAPVPEVPSPAVFNHVITTVNLPVGRVWLDSTPQAAPYQYLSAVIRNQKALVVPAASPAILVSTAADAPYLFSAQFEGVATLDTDGKLTGKITATYRDDDEVLVRALAQNVAPAEWDKASQYISSSTGFGGTTSNTQFTNTEDSASPIVLTYNYERKPYGDWDDRRIVPLFPALEFPTLDSDNTEPQEDIQLGAPRALTAISHVRLPEGYRTDLPDAIHVRTDFATFDKTYRFDGKEIVVERNIVVLKDKVSKSDWKKYQSFTKDISLSSEPWIQLIRPPQKSTIQVVKPEDKGSPAKTSSTDAKIGPGEKITVVTKEAVPAAPAGQPATLDTDTSSNRSAGELIQAAQGKEQAGDLDGAKMLLDKIKAERSDQLYLWSMYAYLAERKGDNDEAIADLHKELENHPDNIVAVRMLSSLQYRSGEEAASRQTLQQFLSHNPGDVQISLSLAALQNRAQDYTGALRTLQASADQNPDNRRVELQISSTLLRLNRNDEAAAAAKSVLDGTDDPALLNDAAYVLSNSGIDLAIAEDASRKSIAGLEEKSAAITTAEVNSHAFADAILLVASWDTLGWIYFRQGKLEAAEPLLMAAWRASLRAEVGDHLGQLYEAMGQKDEAATVYMLAQTAIDKNVAPDVSRHIKESIARLKTAGAKSGPGGTDALQNLRTYKVHRPSDVSGWGSFRLLITTAGVTESQQMSGEQKIAGIKTVLETMKFPGLVPPESKAHLLRSAVVSCSMGTTCEVVLVPDGGLQTEQQ